MANLWSRFLRRRPPLDMQAAGGDRLAARSVTSLDDLIELVKFGGNTYLPMSYSATGNTLAPARDFVQLVQQGYAGNPVVSAVEDVRLALFSEARFTFRQRVRGRPGKLFGTPALQILEQPWEGGTTGELLSLMLLHADFGGNAYVTVIDGRAQLLRPDWVEIVLGSQRDRHDPLLQADAHKLGYLYYPMGRRDQPAQMFDLEEVAHFKWKPDPVEWWRGMSWLTPVVADVQADYGATVHKKRFFDNAATPNLIMKVDPSVTLQQFKEFKEQFNIDHRGAANAYKTLFVGGGVDPVPVGHSFSEIRLKENQGAGETRIAAAAQVPPVLVGLSEGLQAATYSNYGQARRRFADGTLRPLWRNVAGSLAAIVDVPAGAELWYDDTDISFLQEDLKDAAEIQGIEAGSIRTLLDAGYEAASVIDAVTSRDWSRLSHTGLFSVQLQPPGTDATPAAGAAGNDTKGTA